MENINNPENPKLWKSTNYQKYFLRCCSKLKKQYRKWKSILEETTLLLLFIFLCVLICLRGFTTIRKCYTSQKRSWTSILMVYDDFWKKVRGRFIDIGLENVAVAAARVVGGPPRCSNKRVQKRRCLQNVYENHLFVGFRASSGARRGPALIDVRTTMASYVWGNDPSARPQTRFV